MLGAARRLTRFDTVVMAVLVLSRLALIAVDAPHRADIGRGQMPYYEDVYPGLATNLVETGRYIFPRQEPDSDLLRPPGYPLLLAATYLVVGTGPSVVVLLWNVLGVLLLYSGLVRLLAEFGLEGRRVAAVAFAADLAWLLYTTEPVYTPMLVWGVVGLLRAARTNRSPWRPAAKSGLLLGVSALVKPISLYLPVVAVPFLLVAGRQVRPALVFAAAFAICVGPWFVRNHTVHDALSFTSIQNDNLLFAHGAFVWADLHGVTHLEAQAALDAELSRRLGASATYTERNAAKSQLAREVLLGHPLLYARAILRGVAITLFDPGRLVFNRLVPTESTREIGLTNTVARDGVVGTVQAFARKNPLMVGLLGLYLVFLLVVAAGAAAGVVPLWRSSPTAFWLVLLVAAYLLALGGPNGYARFRLYVFPFELVFLQAGAEALVRRWTRRHGVPRPVYAPLPTSRSLLPADAQTD